MIRTGDAGDVLSGKIAVGAIHHQTQLPRVDKQNLTPAVAVFTIAPVARQKPETGRYLSRVEKLAGQRDHAVHQVGFYQTLSDVALSRLVGRHRAVGQHKARRTRGRKVVDDMLPPKRSWHCPSAVPRTASAGRLADARRPNRRY